MIDVQLSTGVGGHTQLTARHGVVPDDACCCQSRLAVDRAWVREASEKFGLYVGNMEFGAQNEE
jgi:hypothetical protein